ncbi:MAG TPA: pitrilysin family protein [Longimicrobiaceae bacterium]|nr:pitrilysin family protein [Longimicrobiaceae bacterium]
MKRLLLVPLLLAASALPAAAQSGPTAESVRLDYVEETLPNGLKVIYHVDRSAPVAAAVVWYDVASKHEPPGRTGFAHLFEHLMLFTGSRNVPEGKGWALLEAAGGRAGPDLNGTTSADRTNYFSQVPSNALEVALWIEADRMATLDEALTQAKLDNQREVVKNERRQGMDNQPYGLWLQKMLGHLFPEGHPYHHPVIGSLEDLNNASLEDVREFFRTYYVPNNAVLVVAGDIEVEEARAMVRRYFAGIPRGPEPPPLRDAGLPPRLGAPVREVVEDANAPAPAVYVGYRMPNARDPRAPVVRTLSSLLASGRSSPLYEALVRRQQVATNVFAFNLGFVDGADVLVVAATGKPGASPDSLERALLGELDGIQASIDEAGLRRVQATTRYGLLNQLQTMGGFGGRGDMLAQGWVFHQDPGWVNRWLEALGTVTVPALRELAAERVVPDNRAVLVFVPRPRATPTPTQP